jgi:hypothetical protein
MPVCGSKNTHWHNSSKLAYSHLPVGFQVVNTTVICCLFPKMKRLPNRASISRTMRQWRQCLSQLFTSLYDGPSTTEFVCQRLSHPRPMFLLTITIAQILQISESGTSVTSSSFSILVFTQVIAFDQRDHRSSQQNAIEPTPARGYWYGS